MLDPSLSGLNLVSQSKPGTNALYLYPRTPDWHIELKSLIDALDAIEMIDKNIPNTSDCFFTGNQFLNYITFLGCAPTIQFDATHDKPDFCFIRLLSSKAIKMIHTRSLSRPPHCPHCKKAVKQWQDYSIAALWNCPHCNKTAHAHEYDWRRTAGFARIFIAITDIYPKEAIPQPSLLEKLASLTHIEWDYFYYCA